MLYFLGSFEVVSVESALGNLIPKRRKYYKPFHKNRYMDAKLIMKTDSSAL